MAGNGFILVAAGSFQDANGTATADNIAYFDGTSWRPVGSDGAGNGPFIGQATSLGITGGKVYVGGNFTSAGGDSLAWGLAASALRLPDASIGATRTGRFVGINVYSKTGAGEVRSVTVTRGSTPRHTSRFRTTASLQPLSRSRGPAAPAVSRLATTGAIRTSPPPCGPGRTPPETSPPVTTSCSDTWSPSRTPARRQPRRPPQLGLRPGHHLMPSGSWSRQQARTDGADHSRIRPTRGGWSRCRLTGRIRWGEG